MTQNMNQNDFDDFLKKADSLTTTEFCTIGTYDAIVWIDDKAYWCTIKSLEGDDTRGTGP